MPNVENGKRLDVSNAIAQAIRPPENHATIEVSADKTITAEAGGTIKQRITWTAYAKKVWRGPWTVGSTWKW